MAIAFLDIETAFANGITRRVDDDSTETSPDGLSWATAYKYLQDALAESGANDVIHVAGGSYRPDLSKDHAGWLNDPSKTFALKDTVAILGGYLGSDLDDEARDLELYPSTLSGQLSTSHSYHVVTAINVDPVDTSILDGFIIEDGDGDGNTTPLDEDTQLCVAPHVPPPNGGAGMQCISSDLQIRNCIFRSNHSISGGGLRLLCNSDPIIVKCVFEDNEATGDPGEGDGGGA